MLIFLFIYRRGNLTYKYKFPGYSSGVLSDSELRWFWMSWLRGNVSYGRGSEPGVKIIDWDADPSPFPISYMSIGSVGVSGSHFVIPSELYRTPSTWCLNYTLKPNTHQLSSLVASAV